MAPIAVSASTVAGNLAVLSNSFHNPTASKTTFLSPSLYPKTFKFLNPISAVQSSSSPSPSSSSKSSNRAAAAIPSLNQWDVDSWKSKKAFQLPEYPDSAVLETVLKTLESFPPIVFAGEARRLEEKLGQAAMGYAFLLQGGDCAESFKEFNANNIRDTFRVILQMGVVLMFGGQLPVIKVNNYNLWKL